MQPTFHEDYRERPFWWGDYEPQTVELQDVPARTRVAVIGAGYAGLAAAIELARLGIEATVFDAGEPGRGASTRSGGLVAGGGASRIPLLARAPSAERGAALGAEADAAFDLLSDTVQRNAIDCGWSPTGRFTGAWSPRHLEAMRARAANVHNDAGEAPLRIVEPDEQSAEIGSDFYHGGMVVRRAAHLQPALYYAGLKRLCEAGGATICARASLQALRQQGAAWSLTTARGPCEAGDVIIATNGYTGDVTPQFRRRVVPLRAYMVATEPLPADLARSLSPRNRSFTDSRRIVTFFRLCSEQRRLIYGSRVKWRDISPTEMAPLLHHGMVQRYPLLADSRVTHAWTGNVALTLDEQPHLGRLAGLHFALGCNGAGVATMTYLGRRIARRIAGDSARSAYERVPFPDSRLYSGKSRWFLPLVGNYLRARDWWDRRAPRGRTTR